MLESNLAAIHLAPGEGVAVVNPLGGSLTFKLRGAETNGTLTAFETSVAGGEGPPLHLHLHEDEIVYTLEGTFRVKLGDELRDAPAGTFVFIPRGVAHTWQNVGDEDARLLAVLTPAGLETFFERFAEPADGASAAERFRALGEEAGMQVVGPPLSRSDPR